MSEQPTPAESQSGLTAEPRTEQGPSGKGSRFWRRLLLTLLILIALVGGSVAALYAYRLPLANRFGPGLASDILGTQVSFTVTGLTIERIDLADIALANGPNARSLSVIPSPDGRSIDTITIDGLTVKTRIDPAGTVTVEGLPDFSQDPQAETSEPIQIRHLVLTDLRVDAETPVGPQVIAGQILLDLGGQTSSLFPIRAKVQLDAPASDSALLIDASLAPDRVSGSVTLDASLAHWLPFLPWVRTATGRVSLDGTLDSGGLDATSLEEAGPAALLAAVSGEATLSWTGVSVTGPDRDAYDLDQGIAKIALGGGQASVSLPNGLTVNGTEPPAALRRLAPEEMAPLLSAPFQIALAETGDTPALLLQPDPSDGWSVQFGMDISGNSGPASLHGTPEKLLLDAAGNPTRLTVTETAIDLVRGAGLPRDLASHVTLGAMDLDLKQILGGGSLPALTIPFQTDTIVYGTLADPLWARQTALKAHGTASLRPAAAGVDLTLDPGSQIKIDGLTGTGDIRLSPRLRLDVTGRDPMRLGVDFADPTGSLTLSGAFRLGQFSLAVPGDKEPLWVSLDRQPVALRHTPKGTSLALGPVDVSAATAALSRAVLRLDFDGKTGTATLNADALSIEGHPILPGAMAATIAISKTDRGPYRFEGPLSLAGGQITANAVTDWDPAGKVSPHVQLETAPIEFGPNRLGLSDLLPPSFLARLPSIPALAGNLSIKTDATLTENGPEGHLTAHPDGLSLTMPEGRLADVSGDIVIDLAHLPATRGVQNITASLNLPGLPTIPVQSRFSIDRNSRLLIEEADLGFLGGGLALVGGTLDPETAGLTGTIRLRRLDLEQALSLMDLEGVTGNGRISGLIPLSVSGEDAVIDQGTVAAEGTGVLQIDNATVNQALATDQQAVKLLGDVLKDFHYDTFSAVINLPKGGEGSIALSIGGANPAVLDGHPFRLNITLQTDFRKLFRVLRDVLRVSTAVLGHRGLQ